MKKVILGATLLASAAFADTISLRADEWCPYDCQPNSDKPGFMIEIAKEVFGKAGHTVDFQLLPWKRTLQQVAEGTYSAAVGASPDDSKEKGLILPAVEQGMSGNVYITLKDNAWKFEGASSLEKIKLGVIAGYSYSDEIDKYIATSKDKPQQVQAVSGDDALTINLKKLDAGKIDVVIEDKAVVLLKAKEMGLSDKIKIAGEDKQGPVYIAFGAKNPKSKEYADMLSSGTEELRKSGKLKEILAKYGLEDWKK